MRRVTDGARTRDLRSHNPMLYLLSYGHQAHAKFYQEKTGGKTRWSEAVMLLARRWRLVSPPQKLCFLVVLLAFVHDLENPGWHGVVDHSHVAVGIVDLYGHTQVVAGLMLVGDL